MNRYIAGYSYTLYHTHHADYLYDDSFVCSYPAGRK